MNVLVIGTNRFSHDSLISLGHDLVMITSLQSAFKNDSERGYRAIHYLSDMSNRRELIALSEAIHDTWCFDRVVSFHDDYQESSIMVSERLGLPNLYTVDEIRSLRDKASMREKLQKEKLTTVSYHVCSSFLDLGIKLELFEYPCVLKPISGTGGVSVSVFENLGDAMDWYKNHDEQGSNLDSQWVIETFVEGVEYSVEALSENGEHFIIAITDKIKNDDNHFIEIGQRVPAAINERQELEISQYVTSVLTALGVKNGPTHTEVILTEQGPEIVESHTRTGGDRIPFLVELACGIDMNLLAAKQAIGIQVSNEIPDNIEFKRNAVVAFKSDSSNPPKKVKRVLGTGSIMVENDVKELRIYKNEGDVVSSVNNRFERSAHVVAVGECAETTEILAFASVNSIHFELD